MAVLFGVQPWQMLRLPRLHREWYEQAARRYREREHEVRQGMLDALGQMLGGSG